MHLCLASSEELTCSKPESARTAWFDRSMTCSTKNDMCYGQILHEGGFDWQIRVEKATRQPSLDGRLHFEPPYFTL